MTEHRTGLPEPADGPEYEYDPETERQANEAEARHRAEIRRDDATYAREVEALAEKLFVAHDRHLDTPAIPLDEIAAGCFHDAEAFLAARAEWRTR